MTDFTLFEQNPSDLSTQTLVVAVACRDQEPVVVHSNLPGEICASLSQHCTTLGMKGKADSIAVTIAPPSVDAETITLMGVGCEDTLTPEVWRRSAGAVTRTTAAHQVAFDVDITGDDFTALVEGAALGAYRYDTYKSEPADQVTEVSFPEGEGRTSTIETATIRAQAVNLARDLVNTPALDLSPAQLVDQARAAVDNLPITMDVWDMEKLRAEGCGGIVGVGQGSSRPPFLVKLSYAPADAKHHVALIGKGITFDSGGISLKPGLNMEDMKSDMGGAATVLAATVAAAALGSTYRITTYLAIAENLPSGTAQRPSDIVKIRNGKTVEVVNTDAEGRLVMADALSLATELKPDAIVDVATLTGAQIVALGNRTAGVMGQGGIPEKIFAASQHAGETMWVMPIPEEMKKANSSLFADVKNVGGRAAGMLAAADFLSNFVADTPWAHIDIAGPSFNREPGWGYTPKGATGMAVRTLVDYLLATTRTE